MGFYQLNLNEIKTMSDTQMNRQAYSFLCRGMPKLCINIYMKLKSLFL